MAGLGWAAESAPAGGMDAVSKLIEQRMQMARDAETVRSNMAREQLAQKTLEENTAYRHDTFGAAQALREQSAGEALGKTLSPGADVTDIAPALNKGMQGPNMSAPAYAPMPVPAPPPGIADPAQDPNAPDPAATGGGPYVPNSPSLASPNVTKRITWLGTPAERQLKQKQDDAAAFIRSLPPGEDQENARYQEALNHPRPPNRAELEDQRQKDREASARLAAQLRPPASNVSVYTGGAGGPMLINKATGTAAPVKNADGSDIRPKDPAAVEQQRANATKVLSHVQTIEDEAKQINDMGLMGPVGGRWGDFMAGTVGAGELAAGDPVKARLLGKFRTDVGLLKSGMAMVHGGARGGGSPGMVARMDMLMNAKSMDLSLFMGATDSFKEWLEGYAKDPSKPAAAGGGDTGGGAPKKGDTKTFPNGSIGVYDGQGWVKQ